jgi:hypothetical protein
MKAAILFAVKVYLLNAIIYFLAMSLITYLGADEYNLKFVLLFSVFPCFSTFYHVYKHIQEVKKLHSNGLKNEDFKVHQVLTLHLPLNKEQVLAKLQTNFPSKEWETENDANMINLKTNSSWKSYGEKIRIKVEQLNNNFSEVFIESKPINPITFFDFGKNQENIIYLQKLLTN